MMKTACLINCFNYREHVLDAIESALRQTRAFDEVVVVDDGSTDGSGEAIRQAFRSSPIVRLIQQTNQGQLSCFNQGFAHTDAELLCFLDADDLYRENYLESVAGVYETHSDVDFVYTDHEFFGHRDGIAGIPGRDIHHGYSTLLTYYLRHWIGAPTSCLSLRRRIASRILPIPYVEQWKTRADDCLVFGASLMGGRKVGLGEPLVRYRVHDRNNFYGSWSASRQDFRRTMAVNQLFEFLIDRVHMNPATLAEYIVEEFGSQPGPLSHQRLRSYLRIARRAALPWRRRFSIWKGLWRRYLKQDPAELQWRHEKSAVDLNAEQRAA